MLYTVHGASAYSVHEPVGPQWKVEAEATYCWWKVVTVRCVYCCDWYEPREVGYAFGVLLVALVLVGLAAAAVVVLVIVGPVVLELAVLMVLVLSLVLLRTVIDIWPRRYSDCYCLTGDMIDGKPSRPKISCFQPLLPYAESAGSRF